MQLVLKSYAWPSPEQFRTVIFTDFHKKAIYEQYFIDNFCSPFKVPFGKN